MKKLALFDVDFTLYAGSSTSDFTMYLVDKGICDGIYKTKDQEMRHLYLTKQIDYTEVTRMVVEMQAQALAGLSESQVCNFANEFLNNKDRFFPFVKELFNVLKSNDVSTFLISAATNPTVRAVAEQLNANGYYSSILEIVDNKYTGRVLKILNNDEKKKTIEKLVVKNKNDSFKMGFGDSTGDIDLLSVVDKAFIINPHQEEIIALAKEKGWILTKNEDIVNEVKIILNNLKRRKQ